jgi:hypothetical protein
MDAVVLRWRVGVVMGLSFALIIHGLVILVFRSVPSLR